MFVGVRILYCRARKIDKIDEIWMNSHTPFTWHRNEFSAGVKTSLRHKNRGELALAWHFAGGFGIMSTNTEPQEGTGVNSRLDESRAGIM